MNDRVHSNFQSKVNLYLLVGTTACWVYLLNLLIIIRS